MLGGNNIGSRRHAGGHGAVAPRLGPRFKGFAGTATGRGDTGAATRLVPGMGNGILKQLVQEAFSPDSIGSHGQLEFDHRCLVLWGRGP